MRYSHYEEVAIARESDVLIESDIAIERCAFVRTAQPAELDMRHAALVQKRQYILNDFYAVEEELRTLETAMRAAGNMPKLDATYHCSCHMSFEIYNNMRAHVDSHKGHTMMYKKIGERIVDRLTIAQAAPHTPKPTKAPIWESSDDISDL